jgi:pyruvate dehydrogenase E1 component
MMGLRAYPSEDMPYTFQSYHSVYDPDHHGFLPSGTVGIPPVNVGYLAHAYRLAKEHGYEVPEAHFWSLIGDSEFREGSVFEATPDFAEREIGNLTWIVDYNRQSLDGHRITNKTIMGGTDNERIERTMAANGWDVIQVRHGKKRQALFERKGGKVFKKWLEEDLEDYELQALLLVQDMKELKKGITEAHSDLKEFLNGVNDAELFVALRDLGGNDIERMVEALEESKKNPRKPCIIIAHTVKGWGLKMAAAQGNHSSLPTGAEVKELQELQGIGDELFAGFEDKSEEGKFLKKRGSELLKNINDMKALKEKNKEKFLSEQESFGEIPNTFGINTKMASYPHTQWMLGQCTAKLTRIANTSLKDKELEEKQKALDSFEKAWKKPAEFLISMAPDVGTSTNLNPAMDGKIFGATAVEEWEDELEVRDTKLPDLVPGEDASDRFLRFEIAECNVMSCMGSYGMLREFLGIPILPLMTVYDFFIKRAHDQFFYNLYWKSSFILVGTPSGVTLSPEGAQHGWKSDFQIPNQITWEPFFCAEMDWILADAIRRHHTYDNIGRNGVVIRGVTRGIDQKMFMKFLKTQRRFKQDLNESTPLHAKTQVVEGATDESSVSSFSEDQILEQIRNEVLSGAYYLIDYRGYAGYEPGDNVVNIFAMGAMATEAIRASEELLQKGIYANVIIVTSSDLVAGNLAHESNYSYLRDYLSVTGELYLQPNMNGSTTAGEMATVAGRRVPIVSVHDGEPGLLDNLGSIVGVRHESLAVRKHSKCGRPEDVYAFQKINHEAVIEACGKVLSETALENVKVSQRVLSDVDKHHLQTDWRNFWN